MGNVMLTGGNTMFEGLPQMLYKKLKSVRILLGWLAIYESRAATHRLALAGRQGEGRVAQDRGLKRPPDLRVGWRCAMLPPCPAHVHNQAIVKARSLCRVGAGFVADLGGGADHAG